MNHIPYATSWNCPKCGSASFRQSYEVNMMEIPGMLPIPVEPLDERLRMRCSWCNYDRITMKVKTTNEEQAAQS